MTQRETSYVNKELFQHKYDLISGSDVNKELTRKRKHIAWRRQKVFQLLVQGVTSSYDISSILKVSQSTASRDIRFWKQQATKELRTHIRERVPWTYKICNEGISEVLRHAWSIILDENNSRANKIATLQLIAACYKDLLDISTNGAIITDALQQVERMKNQMLEKLDK